MAQTLTRCELRAYFTAFSRNIRARIIRGANGRGARRRLMEEMEEMEADRQSGFCLVVDVGSQSIRAALMDRSGDLSCLAKTEVDFELSHELGWSEWELSSLWGTLCLTVRECLSRHASSSVPTVLSIAVTCMRDSLVLIDEHGHPIRSCITWQDGRRSSGRTVNDVKWAQVLELFGLCGNLREHSARAAINWVNEHEPDAIDRAHYIGFLSAYLNFKLTGQWVDAVASQVGHLPFDYKRQAWYPQHHWMARLLAVEVKKLPELKLAGTTLGKLIQASAREWGLPVGIPVVAAGSDKACEFIGSGGMAEHSIAVSCGTTISVCAADGIWRSPLRGAPSFPAVKPREYITEYTIYRGFWLVSWFIQEFCADIQQVAKERGGDPEQVLERWVAGVPAGCEGLVVQPYWTPVSRYVRPTARGAILGIQDYHSRPYFLRGILEGLMFEVRASVELMRMRFTEPFTTLVVSGGGAVNHVWLQMLASGTGMEVVRTKELECSLVGAGLCAGVGLGWWKDFSHAQDVVAQVADRFVPAWEDQKVYDELYAKVYSQLYGRLNPIHRSIMRSLRVRNCLVSL